MIMEIFYENSQGLTKRNISPDLDTLGLYVPLLILWNDTVYIRVSCVSRRRPAGNPSSSRPSLICNNNSQSPYFITRMTLTLRPLIYP